MPVFCPSCHGLGDDASASASAGSTAANLATALAPLASQALMINAAENLAPGTVLSTGGGFVSTAPAAGTVAATSSSTVFLLLGGVVLLVVVMSVGKGRGN